MNFFPLVILLFWKKIQIEHPYEGGGWKFRFFNYRRIEWNLIIFCEKFSFSPISNFNVKFDFQKWFTCWEDFRNFEENFFCFPHSTPTCKIGHDYLLKKWYFLKSFFQNVDHIPHTWHQSTYQNQTVSYMSVNFTKKNHFFGSRFFKFHRHVIHFLCKKRAKKRLPVVIFIKKFSGKNEKNKKFFSNFHDMWHKKSTFSRNFYIWVILRKTIQFFEKFRFRCFVNNFIKLSIVNMKVMILTTVNT